MKDPGARWLRSAPHATVVTRSDHWQGLILAVKAGAGLATMPHFQGDNESDLVRVIDDIGLVVPYYLLMHPSHAPRHATHSSSARLRRFRVVGNQVVSRALVERQCRWRLAAGSACITVLPRAEPVLLLQIGPAAVKGHHFRSGRHAGGFGGTAEPVRKLTLAAVGLP